MHAVSAFPDWNPVIFLDVAEMTTGLALSIGNIVGGALITEVIFAYPGLGYLIYNAIRGSDFPVVQGSVLLLVVTVAGANLILDLANPLIDPRIRAARS